MTVTASIRILLKLHFLTTAFPTVSLAVILPIVRWARPAELARLPSIPYFVLLMAAVFQFCVFPLVMIPWIWNRLHTWSLDAHGIECQRLGRRVYRLPWEQVREVWLMPLWVHFNTTDGKRHSLGFVDSRLARETVPAEKRRPPNKGIEPDAAGDAQGQRGVIGNRVSGDGDGAGRRAAHPQDVMPHQPRGRMPDDPAKPPRFPYVAALLCAACLGAAVWTWMAYSFAFSLNARLPSSHHMGYVHDTGIGMWDSHHGGYYAVRGVVLAVFPLDWRGMREVLLLRTPPGDAYVCVLISADDPPPSGAHVAYVGRALVTEDEGDRGKRFRLDASANRFTGASIAGLVVAAMGVWVFSVALRHWLGERRRFREGTEGA